MYVERPALEELLPAEVEAEWEEVPAQLHRYEVRMLEGLNVKTWLTVASKRSSTVALSILLRDTFHTTDATRALLDECGDDGLPVLSILIGV